MKTETIEQLTSLRVRLDGVEKSVEALPKTRYSSLALTALETGRMYVGEVCRELGKEYPYEATKKAIDASGIQPAVDLSTTGSYLIGDNEIVNLNTLREDLEKHTQVLLDVVANDDFGQDMPDDPEKFLPLISACNGAYQGLKEARMWLGKRLGEIRDKVVEHPLTPSEANEPQSSNPVPQS
jgi:hypothetical protein